MPEVDTVMAAIVGIAGLRASFAAVKAGKRVLLANKEALVTAGPVFMQAVRAHGATLLPIDSEHNAVFQALPRTFAGDLAASGVRRIVLTASGGPFLNVPRERLPRRDARSGMRASELGDGAQDFGRFGHHDEQGAGNHRSELAVQRR